MKYVITLDEDEIPENCGECSFSNHCGECLADGGRCNYESKIRPSSCPIKNLSDVEEYNKVCEERDKLKEENTNWKVICNALVNNNDLPIYKGADDFLPKVEGKLLTENDVF